jgi:hypothetical protein
VQHVAASRAESRRMRGEDGIGHVFREREQVVGDYLERIFTVCRLIGDEIVRVPPRPVAFLASLSERQLGLARSRG